MSKTIKIIDLLNKIANKEIKQGTKIILEDMTFIYDYPNTCGIYREGYNTTRQNDFYYFIDTSNLNAEVEIIEDEEQIDIESIEELKTQMILGNQKIFDDRTAKVNELIRAVKQINRKLEEKKYGRNTKEIK